MQRDPQYFTMPAIAFSLASATYFLTSADQFSAIVCIPLARFGWISHLSAKIPQLASPALAGTSETAACANVRLWHKADMGRALEDVCFWG